MTRLQRASRVVFWHQHLSPHTHDLIGALAQSSPDLEVISCSAPGLDAQRSRWIWEDRSFHEVTEIAAQDASETGLFGSRSTGTVHILYGPAKTPLTKSAVREMKRTGERPIIMSEPRVSEGIKGRLRIIDSMATEGWLRSQSAAVLAIGRHGPDWFVRVGYPRDRIFPFAYFVPPLTDQTCSFGGRTPGSHGTRLKIGFVGRFVKTKGVDELIKSLTRLDFDAELVLVGSGPREDYLRQLSRSSRHSVVFLGAIQHSALGSVVRDLDCLVLPSRSTDDGWGVVVSEALMEGVPVIATECVGASVLLGDRDGVVVAARAPQQLARALSTVRNSSMNDSEVRLERSVRARRFLTPGAGATYLRSILDYLFLEGRHPKGFPPDDWAAPKALTPPN